VISKPANNISVLEVHNRRTVNLA